ncbi:nuclear transport factor 2 family protein [Zhihengliuella halotolerans]|uniref:SnoaL-like protein n=1 Tax=Zhihengliuella halotolerans TaxID=370736 RepID=A0A4Q8AEB0_9MICC|nr:nuclear transport factor 2 family protein [Zhihengliuella halotolerans]RZU62602.1 SnoaL-like protein [Zhihengliuella halotolerans]
MTETGTPADTAREPSTDEVLAVAAEIVAAFAATDTARYFAHFAPEATFVFHPEDDRLDSRAAYEALWDSWLRSGWSVTSCNSANPHVQTFPGGAVFAHDVATAVSTPDGDDSYRERESIVFRVDGERLVAIHEHLSPAPDAA